MKKTFVSFLLFLCVLFFAPSTQAGEFSDVNTGHEYFIAIEYLKFMGVVEGYLPEGYNKPIYEPDDMINRAEFTKIVVEGYFSDDEIEDCDTRYFIDLVQGEWYVPYICVAKENGLVSGYPDGSFQPANEINFVEAAKIISNTFDFDYYEDATWYQSYVENLENAAAIPIAIDDFDQNISRGEMAEMIYLLMREITYKETQRFFTDQPKIPGEPEESACGRNSYTMAFIVLTRPGEELSDPESWTDLAQAFEEGFFKATDYRVEVNVDSEIFSLELDESMINDFYLEGYESGEYSLDNLVSSSHLYSGEVVEKFYETEEDDYDFLSIYFDFEPQENDPPRHATVRQLVEGIGNEIQDDGAAYGSDSRLLGWNWMEDKDSISSEVRILIHETGHQWCCYAGDPYEREGENILPIGGDSHQYMGLDGPDSTAVMGSVGSYYVFNKEDETYLSVSTTYSGVTLFHPFVLYFMGVLPEEDYDTEWDLYDVEDEDQAIYYGSYSVNDIIDYEGERSCEEL